MKNLLFRYKEQILYLVFGVLTTLVNYIVYFLCTAGLHIGWSPAKVAAWIAAVAFAYITNKLWVFENRDTGLKALVREIGLFIGARLLSLGFDWCAMYVCMEWAHMGDFHLWGLPAGEFIALTISQVIVVIMNYFFSKWLIFRKKE